MFDGQWCVQDVGDGEWRLYHQVDGRFDDGTPIPAEDDQITSEKAKLLAHWLITSPK